MTRLRDDPIIAVAAALLLVLLGGTLAWAAVPRLGLPNLALTASFVILWAVVSLLVCAQLFLSLRLWPLAVVLAMLWTISFAARAARSPDFEASLALVVGSILPACLIIGIGLIVMAGYLFPPSGESLRWKALQALITFTMGSNHPYYAVVSQGDEENELVERVGGHVLFGLQSPAGVGLAAGPGIVLTGADHAVVISDGLRLKGIEGPGVVFTGLGDQPIQTIDLRPHYRDLVVRAVTKDGIRVVAGVYVAFEMDRGGQRPTVSRPFPYGKRAAFAALSAQRMQHLPDEVREFRWYDLPGVSATRILQDIVAGCLFDELYETGGRLELGGHQSARLVGDGGSTIVSVSDSVGSDPRGQILGAFQDRLSSDLAASGIHVVAAGVTNLLPVDGEAVLGQKVENWQASWVQRTMLRRAEGEAERLRLVAEARARAQEALILALGKRLGELSRPGTVVPAEDVARWFLEALQEMAYRPSVLPLLPRETTDMLDQILHRLEPDRGPR